MKFLRDVKAVSEFLFFVEGILILIALVLWRNDVFVYESELFLRYADLPFALNALIFVGVTTRLAFAPKESDPEGTEETLDNPILDAVVIAGVLLIFGILLFVDLGFPDKI